MYYHMIRKTLSHDAQKEYSPNYRSGVDTKPPSFFPFYTYDGLEILLYVCP